MRCPSQWATFYIGEIMLLIDFFVYVLGPLSLIFGFWFYKLATDDSFKDKK